MEFEDHEEQDEEELGLPPSYDSLDNTARLKMPSPARADYQKKPRYIECLKNHAVGIGGHAVDGCREFMPAGAEGSLDALKCAACLCHRNFHRKQTDSTITATAVEPFNFYHHLLTPHQHGQFSPYYRTPSGYLHVAPPHQRPLALPSTSGGGGSGEDQEDMSNPSCIGGDGVSKKRVRTKFTPEQKEKMLGFAEKLEWTFQKQDEVVVQQFCNEIGVKRKVLKVWMHNNKQTLASLYNHYPVINGNEDMVEATSKKTEMVEAEDSSSSIQSGCCE